MEQSSSYLVIRIFSSNSDGPPLIKEIIMITFFPADSFAIKLPSSFEDKIFSHFRCFNWWLQVAIIRPSYLAFNLPFLKAIHLSLVSMDVTMITLMKYLDLQNLATPVNIKAIGVLSMHAQLGSIVGDSTVLLSKPLPLNPLTPKNSSILSHSITTKMVVNRRTSQYWFLRLILKG
ncbi:hypothetical protein TNCT_338541 [Trichonephila clavata]|uniref:Uncharacterized protein n=1 Tax=Trichonephila clavata TaxID=2740835 RepID=A0A8X6M5A5_TRICU|nr:hypothetical protein TNCT_338541 [Trichonephila clavata]